MQLHLQFDTVLVLLENIIKIDLILVQLLIHDIMQIQMINYKQSVLQINGHRDLQIHVIIVQIIQIQVRGITHIIEIQIQVQLVQHIIQIHVDDENMKLQTELVQMSDYDIGLLI